MVSCVRRVLFPRVWIFYESERNFEQMRSVLEQLNIPGLEIIRRQFYRPPVPGLESEVCVRDHVIIIAKGNVGGRLILLDDTDTTSYYPLWARLKEKGKLFLKSY